MKAGRYVGFAAMLVLLSQAALAEPFDGRYRGSADALTKLFIPDTGPQCAGMDVELEINGNQLTGEGTWLRTRKAPRVQHPRFWGTVSDTGEVMLDPATGWKLSSVGRISGDTLSIVIEGAWCRYEMTLRRL